MIQTKKRLKPISIKPYMGKNLRDAFPKSDVGESIDPFLSSADYEKGKVYVFDKREKNKTWSLHIDFKEALKLVKKDKNYYLLD